MRAGSSPRGDSVTGEAPSFEGGGRRAGRHAAAAGGAGARASEGARRAARRESILLSHRAVLVWTAVAVAVPAAVLRLWDLGAVGFNSDEAVYAGQAAAIAGDSQLSQFFPVFRAHPLLFQLLVSVAYRVDVSELAPRLLAVAFGVVTVAAGYALGARSTDAGPECLRRSSWPSCRISSSSTARRCSTDPWCSSPCSPCGSWRSSRPRSVPGRLYAAGAVIGLAFLTKETAVLLVPAAYAFFAVTPGRAGEAEGSRALAGMLRAGRACLSGVAGRRGRVARPGPLPGRGSCSGPPNHSWHLLPDRGPARHRRSRWWSLAIAGVRRAVTRHSVVVARVAAGLLDRRARLLLPAVAGEGLSVPVAGRRRPWRCWRPDLLAARGWVRVLELARTRRGAQVSDRRRRGRRRVARRGQPG